MRVLVHYPQGLPALRKAFGDLSRQEALRTAALAEELAGDPYAAEETWRELADELSTCLDEEGNRLRAALILRHLADMARGQQVMGARCDASSSLQYLAESLLLDPEDRPTHLRLITGYRGMGRLKAAREALKEALDRFPDDTEVLLEAVETAIAGDAFKKAARYARSVLDIDPINPRVRDILLDAHLAHARKQIRMGSYALAKKELATAGSWAQSMAARGRVLLVQGMMAVRSQNIETARELLREAVQALGGGLAGQFELLLEAARLQLRPATVLQQAQLPRPIDLAAREQVIALIHGLKAVVGERDMQLVEECLEPLRPALRRGAKLAYTEKEYELICETLYQHELFRLLQQYAKEALRRYRQRPVFVYQQLYGKAQGFILDLSSRDLEALEKALDQAQEQGDMRTTHRIVEFLKPPSLPPLPTSMGAEFLDGIGEVEAEQLMDLLRGRASPREFAALAEIFGEENLAKLMQAMISGLDPEEVLQELLAPPLEGRKRPRRRRRPTHPNQGDLFE